MPDSEQQVPFPMHGPYANLRFNRARRLDHLWSSAAIRAAWLLCPWAMRADTITSYIGREGGNGVTGQCPLNTVFTTLGGL